MRYLGSNASNVLGLRNLNTGNQLKAGDQTVLKYQLTDTNDEVLDLQGKTAKVYLKQRNKTIHLTTVDISEDLEVRFVIDNVLHPGSYELEIVVEDDYFFPSDNSERIIIYPSYLSLVGEEIEDIIDAGDTTLAFVREYIMTFVQNYIDDSTFIAGENITIDENNVISAIDHELRELVETKQIKLVAGDNIELDVDGNISAIDTVYDDTELRQQLDDKQESILWGENIVVDEDGTVHAVDNDTVYDDTKIKQQLDSVSQHIDELIRGDITIQEFIDRLTVLEADMRTIKQRTSTLVSDMDALEAIVDNIVDVDLSDILTVLDTVQADILELERSVSDTTLATDVANIQSFISELSNKVDGLIYVGPQPVDSDIYRALTHILADIANLYSQLEGGVPADYDESELIARIESLEGLIDGYIAEGVYDDQTLQKHIDEVMAELNTFEQYVDADLIPTIGQLNDSLADIEAMRDDMLDLITSDVTDLRGQIAQLRTDITALQEASGNGGGTAQPEDLTEIYNRLEALEEDGSYTINALVGAEGVGYISSRYYHNFIDVVEDSLDRAFTDSNSAPVEDSDPRRGSIIYKIPYEQLVMSGQTVQLTLNPEYFTDMVNNSTVDVIFEATGVTGESSSVIREQVKVLDVDQVITFAVPESYENVYVGVFPQGYNTANDYLPNGLGLFDEDAFTLDALDIDSSMIKAIQQMIGNLEHEDILDHSDIRALRDRMEELENIAYYFDGASEDVKNWLFENNAKALRFSGEGVYDPENLWLKADEYWINNSGGSNYGDYYAADVRNRIHPPSGIRDSKLYDYQNHINNNFRYFGSTPGGVFTKQNLDLSNKILSFRLNPLIFSSNLEQDPFTLPDSNFRVVVEIINYKDNDGNIFDYHEIIQRIDIESGKGQFQLIMPTDYDILYIFPVQGSQHPIAVNSIRYVNELNAMGLWIVDDVSAPDDPVDPGGDSTAPGEFGTLTVNPVILPLGQSVSNVELLSNYVSYEGDLETRPLFVSGGDIPETLDPGIHGIFAIIPIDNSEYTDIAFYIPVIVGEEGQAVEDIDNPGPFVIGLNQEHLVNNIPPFMTRPSS